MELRRVCYKHLPFYLAADKFLHYTEDKTGIIARRYLQTSAQNKLDIKELNKEFLKKFYSNTNLQRLPRRVHFSRNKPEVTFYNKDRIYINKSVLKTLTEKKKSILEEFKEMTCLNHVHEDIIDLLENLLVEQKK